MFFAVDTPPIILDLDRFASLPFLDGKTKLFRTINHPDIRKVGARKKSTVKTAIFIQIDLVFFGIKDQPQTQEPNQRSTNYLKSKTL